MRPTTVNLAHAVPVLRRTDGWLQVGLAPSRSVVLPPAAEPLLRACDGTLGRDDIVAQLGAGASSTLALLLRNHLVVAQQPLPGSHDAVLRAHGLAAGVPHADVRVVGGGRLGSTIAMLVSAMGLPQVRVVDPRPVTAADVTPWGANRIDIGVRRDHTCAALLERMHRGAQSHHARPGPRDQPAVDILVLDQVADWPWLDARAATDQMAADVAHLVVAPGSDCVAITHVIEPGVTPCLGCHHHAQADADGQWPQLCLQLAQRTAVDTADLGLVLVGAWRAAQTLAEWLLGRGRRAGAQYVGLDNGNVMRAWERHPACGCAWDSGD